LHRSLSVEVIPNPRYIDNNENEHYYDYQYHCFLVAMSCRDASA
jgi:hypothetical protein